MTYEQCRAAVAEEIRAAAHEGTPWTAYRPFLCSEERIGAMRCGCEGRRRDGSFTGRWCRKPSAYVSYCSGLDGRTVMCEECYRHREQESA